MRKVTREPVGGAAMIAWLAVPAALLVSLATFQGPMGLLLAFLALSVALVWRAKIMLRRIRKWYSRKGWIVRKLY